MTAFEFALAMVQTLVWPALILGLVLWVRRIGRKVGRW